MGASVSTVVGATMALLVSTEMGVAAPTTALTIAAQMTQPKMGTFVPPFIVGVHVSTSVPTSPNPQVRARFDDTVINMQNFSKDQPYGMPTSMMANLHNNPVFTEHANPFTPFNKHSPSSSSVFGRNASPALTTESMMLFRQQMDETNHEMVNLLTPQSGTVFNPLIQNMNQGYQALATQMGRIADFFAPPQTVYQRIPKIQNIPQIQNTQPVQIVEPIVQRQQHVPRPQPIEPMVQAQPEVILVDKNHDANEVVRNVQQQNIEANNNIANLVENIMAQNGLNVGLHRPNFVSILSEYVLQTELPRGYKIPKFITIAGDTSESTIEHIARYLTEAGDIANNENLRLKFFPNSLTKNAFTWFTMLALHSIHHWTQLERLFHEQFYMGQSKKSLKELASVRRQITESIHDYLNRFRLLKTRCFTQVPEHELVKIAASGLDYSITKKIRHSTL